VSRSGGIAVLLFLTAALDGGEWSVSCFGHFAFGYSLGRWVVGLQSQSRHCGLEKMPLLGIEPHLASLLPVTIPTELSQLQVKTDYWHIVLHHQAWGFQVGTV
jgi:hypothetical protein